MGFACHTSHLHKEANSTPQLKEKRHQTDQTYQDQDTMVAQKTRPSVRQAQSKNTKKKATRQTLPLPQTRWAEIRLDKHAVSAEAKLLEGTPK